MKYQSLTLYRFIQFISRCYCYLTYECHLIGSANLPSDRPFVLASNHRDNRDTWVLGALPLRPMWYLAKHQLWTKEFLWAGYWFFNFMGTLRVERGNVTQELYDQCKTILQWQRQPVALYPEGRRRTGQMIESIKPGAVRIALDSNVPLIPMAIHGTEKVLRSKKFRTPLVVVIGRPVKLDEDATEEENVERLRLAMQEVLDQAIDASQAVKLARSH